ncbi:Pepco domain-containing protein [Streptomyces sp. CA-111067]|uniref:Pepco domain-containing protein n=1 Tax=Streptomyces sp. CA-111067 TaxID=3240046 RepID=UPI003D969DA1
MSDSTTSDSTTAALPFWVSPVDETGDGDDSLGILGGDAVLRSVPLGPLRKNLAATVDALQEIFNDVIARGGSLPLAEAQLSFEVTASGGVQLIGTGQVQGSRGLTLTFKRP